jgi:Zn-dependent peptidase ImmA (M78 family)
LTKQMVCGYALGHYLEHQILMDLHTLNKSLAITDKQICLYEPNAFASHLMLDSEEVYQMTKRKMDAAQIADAKRIHINLVLVKLLELHRLGYDLRHYHAQHHAFIKQLNLPEYYRFDAAG